MLSTLLDVLIAYTVIAFSGYVLLIPTMIYRRDTFTAIARLMSDYNYGGYVPVVIYNLIAVGVAASTMLFVEWNAQFVPALLTAATGIIVGALAHAVWVNYLLPKLSEYVVTDKLIIIGYITVMVVGFTFYVLTHMFYLNMLS